MATKQHERTLQMMKCYVDLFNGGLSPKEIADKFNLSSWTVYHYLPEIAANAGVSRESLLRAPHASPLTYEREFVPLEPVDLKNFEDKFESIMAIFLEVEQLVKVSIDELEAYESEIERRMAEWN